jgi:5-methylcytosine-specific restriction endonuclease McrA
MEVDHVVPMARWNLQYPQAQEAVNGWQNLFPLPMHENRVKNKRILPEYIRRVWRLREEYLNERRR